MFAGGACHVTRVDDFSSQVACQFYIINFEIRSIAAQEAAIAAQEAAIAPSNKTS